MYDSAYKPALAMETASKDVRDLQKNSQPVIVHKVQESHRGPIICHRCRGNHLTTFVKLYKKELWNCITVQQKKMIAEILTKPLPRGRFETFRKDMGIEKLMNSTQPDN